MFNHPWREVVPDSRAIEKFIRVTKYPTFAGSWSYDRDAYNVWIRQTTISRAILNKNESTCINNVVGNQTSKCISALLR